MKTVVLFILASVVAASIFFCLTWAFWLGGHGWGPYHEVDATITRAYVDTGDKHSHYMVGTDNGVFEVQNGFLLGVYNADEIYSKFRENHKYHIKTKGNKIVWWFGIQEYPYVVKADELK